MNLANPLTVQEITHEKKLVKEPEKTTIRMDAALKKALEDYCSRRNMTQTQAIEEGIRLRIEADAAGELLARLKPEEQALLEVLRSDDILDRMMAEHFRNYVKRIRKLKAI